MGGPGDRRAADARARRSSTRSARGGRAGRKGSRRKESFLLALEGAAPDFLLKVNQYESLPPWRRLRRSKARAELARATMLAARGIPTPIPIVVGELRHAGLLVCCYGLVRWMPDAMDLLRVGTEARDDAASRRAWTRELGVLVRRMHEAGVHQEDLAPNNFLWRPAQEPRLFAIDFERTRVGRRVPTRERVFALAKLERHFAGAPASARMRWLMAYADGNREHARRWWQDVAAFAPQLARRDLSHWRRTATRPGRRFDTLELEAAGVVWRGFARRGAPLETLTALLAGELPNASLPPEQPVLVRRLEALRGREAAVAWGLAQMLYQRRLMPEPLVLLRSPGAAVLMLRCTGDLVSMSEAPAAERHAALVVAIDRLRALGVDATRLRIDAFAFAKQQRRVLLLDPTGCELGRVAAGAGRATAREWATRLLA